MKPLVWLHLTDIHRGQPGERTRWPVARGPLLEDLRAMARELGPPDLIIITGDLAFSGQGREYKLVAETLAEVQAAVGAGQGGPGPLLVVVPGNHDLRRPSSGDALARGLSHYHEDREVRRALLSPRSDTHKGLRKLFRDFEKFWKATVLPSWEAHKAGAGAGSIRGVDYRLGCLPGDFLLRVETPLLRLGLVGLNSAFLQLGGGDFERRLAVEPEQLPGDLAAFVDDTDAALLLMHHPPDWLEGDCRRRRFEQLIYPPGRFIGCLHGHMHESRSLVELGASNLPRRYLQGSSLFGLEHYGDGAETRETGYAWYRLRRVGPDAGLLERFARRGVVRDDGSLTLAEDQRAGAYPQAAPVPLRRGGATSGEITAVLRRSASANPFGHVGRITDPAMFVGRKELLRSLFEELGKGANRALVGPAQIGKSSLLSMVQRLGPAQLGLAAADFVYLNLQVLADAGDFFDALCQELGLAPCRGYRLERQLRGRRVILCIDEVEKLKSDRFPIDVREQLRGLADGADAPFTLLIASRSPLEHIFPDAPGLTSPLHNICPQLDVPPFSEAECRELIRQRLSGHTVAFSEAEIGELIARSGRLPAALERAAAVLFDSCLARGLGS